VSFVFEDLFAVDSSVVKKEFSNSLCIFENLRKLAEKMALRKPCTFLGSTIEYHFKRIMPLYLGLRKKANRISKVKISPNSPVDNPTHIR